MNDKKSVKYKSSLLHKEEFKLNYLKPMYWGDWLAVVFLFFVMFLPAFVINAIANTLGDLLRNTNKKRRHIARINIDLCFPEFSDEEKKDLIKRNFRHQARSVLYYGLLWWAPRFILKKCIKIKGEENIESSLKSGRSVIFMAAHSLGLETAIAAVSMKYASSGPFNPMKNEMIDWLVAKGRLRHGAVIYKREVGLRPIIKDVRGGSTMFYLPDEDLGAERSIFVPFFGVEKASVPVLGRLAKSCKADVLPCMACYDEQTHQYIVHVLPAIKNFPVGDDYEDTLQMNKALEEVIRLCPSQYFWIMKLFKTQADGKTKRY